MQNLTQKTHRLEQHAPKLLTHAAVVQTPYELAPMEEGLVDVVVLKHTHLAEHLVDGGQPGWVKGGVVIV